MELNLREYQKEIFERGRTDNTLVVIPTGLGKTFIAFALIDYFLNKNKGAKALFLAPTKPLAHQHMKTSEDFLNHKKNLLTGKINPKERTELWENSEIIFATPQTIRNDLKKNRISIKDVSIIIFDEAHRATGDYAYNYIAREYIRQADGRIIGMTASPGYSEEDILNVCQNLYISKIEHRSESDIKEYVKEKDIEKVSVDFPEQFREILDLLVKCEENKRDELISKGYQKYKLYRKSELLKMQGVLMEQIRKKKFFFLKPLYLCTQIIKIRHAQELIQTQGLTSLKNYFEKLKSQKNRSASQLLQDDLFVKAMYLTDRFASEGLVHPKYKELTRIVRDEINKGASKIILFTNFRETSKLVEEFLSSIENVKPVRFFGQKEGMSQKKQIETLEKFKKGDYNVLISTSIGEEGIHIDEADLGVFFEPVPSVLRMIQRKGRIGRTNIGRIYVLLTNGCIDERYYHISRAKEKKMNKVLKDVKLDSQTRLEIFNKKDKA
ncbi:MAG: DEAD/DEAH box helicase family protein [Candidatus Nanoarchaeia archaeon]|nr:DEAD/DEAH box helicase family protein [Candidatus Nanoarchaeia archaeon]